MRVFIFMLTFGILSCGIKPTNIQDNSSLETHRVEYKAGFLKDPRSPLVVNDLPYLDFFTENKAWNLTCNCTLVENATPFELPTYSGVTRTYILYAKVACPYKKILISIEIYKNIHQPINPLYKNHLFLPFKDLTNGDQTYGGGRYINLQTTDIKNGNINIDFNKCYNPWCAYSDGYNCPIPPKANHIDLSVEAGEKMYLGEHKQAKQN
ncbi:MAG: DUF1684 domain-containing protein [Saprospiraceae bacterium]